MKQAILMGAVVLAGATSAGEGKGGAEDVAASIGRLKRELVQAYVRCDPVELDRIYADDFLVADAQGQARTKADELAEARAGKCGLASGTYEPVAVRVFGDVAVMSGHARLVVRDGGAEREVRYYSFNVFRRDGGRWRYVAAFTP